MPPSNLDLFSKQAALYAKYRPTYPSELFDFLASVVPGHGLVWDVGTGNGQASVELASRFDRVVGTDLSAAQLSYAVPRPNIRYCQTSPAMEQAEMEPLLGPPGSVDLVTVAQAMHWFDFDPFFATVNAVVRKPGGVVAAWTYTLPRFTPALDSVVDSFYTKSHPFWEPQRRYIDEEYRTIPFPFRPLPGRSDTGPIPFHCSKDMRMEDLIGALGSWSATQTAKERGVDLLDEETRRAFREAWGDKEVHTVRWPVFLRVGVVGGR